MYCKSTWNSVGPGVEKGGMKSRFQYNYTFKSLYVSFYSLVSNCTILTIYTKLSNAQFFRRFAIHYVLIDWVNN